MADPKFKIDVKGKTVKLAQDLDKVLGGRAPRPAPSEPQRKTPAAKR